MSSGLDYSGFGFSNASSHRSNVKGGGGSGTSVDSVTSELTQRTDSGLEGGGSMQEPHRPLVQLTEFESATQVKLQKLGQRVLDNDTYLQKIAKRVNTPGELSFLEMTAGLCEISRREEEVLGGGGGPSRESIWRPLATSLR